jgi:hypothetical protein
VDTVPGPPPGPATASGDRSVAIGGPNSGIIITGDGATVFPGGYERLADVRQYADDLIARLDLPHFVGRRWLAESVDAFLRDQDRGYVVLEAGAGLGKTAFCAWLARGRGYPLHFAQLPGGDRPEAALKNLAAQLIEAYRLEEEFAPDGVIPPSYGTPDGFAGLLAAAAGRARPLVLVVDGLDDLPARRGEMPLGLPAGPPSGAYLLVSRRPGDQLLPIDGPQRYLTVQAAAGPDQPPTENEQDMLEYLRAAVAQPPLSGLIAAAGLSADAFTGLLAAKCAGVWIYLTYVLAEMRAGHRPVADLTTLPDSLWQYYGTTFQRSRDEDPGRWDTVLLPLLATLGAASEPVTFGRLCALAGVPAQDRWRLVLDGPWRPFLQVQDESLDAEPRYAVYHASLRDFLAGRLSPQAQAQLKPVWPLIRQLRQALTERHGQIADYYLSAWGGLTAGLPALDRLDPVDGLPAARPSPDGGGYGLRHVAGHLLGAGRPGDLQELLACQWARPGTAAGHANAWFTARDRAGDLAGYLRDVQLAWQAATDSGGGRPQAAPAPAPPGPGDPAGPGLEIRYALVTSSVANLAATLPVQLITALAEHGVWPAAQALAYSRQLSDPDRRAAALTGLGPLVPPAQQPAVLAEALAAARQIANPDDQVEALAALAPKLPAGEQPAIWAEALAVACPATVDQGLQSLLILADLAPDGLLGEMLAAAWRIPQAYLKAQALAALAPRLPDDRRWQAWAGAIAATRDIDREDLKAGVLAFMAPGMPDDAVAETLAYAWQVTGSEHRVRLLAALAPRLPAGQLGALLTEADRVTGGEDRVRLLVAVAPCLPPGLREQALQAALTTARQITDTQPRMRALAAVAPCLPPGPREQVWAEALAATREVTDGRQHLLAELVPQLPPAQQEQAWPEALAVVSQERIQSRRTQLLSQVVPYLPAGLLAEALDGARQITDTRAQMGALAGLIPQLSADQQPAFWDRALAVARESSSVDAMAELAPHLPADEQRRTWADVLDAIHRGSGDYQLAWNLSLVAPRLPADLQEQAWADIVDAARRVDLGYQADILTGVAAQQPARLREQVRALAAEAARHIKDPDARASKLIEVARLAPAGLEEHAWTEVLESVRLIADADRRASLAAFVAGQAPDSLPARTFIEALTPARPVGDGEPAAPPAAGWPVSWPAATLDLVGQVRDIFPRGDLLRALAQHTPAGELPAAFGTAAQLTDPYMRTVLLAALAPRLPADLAAAALAAAGRLEEESSRAQVLQALAPAVPASLTPDALAAAGQLTDEHQRGQVLAALVPQLPDDLLGQALAAARVMTTEDGRAPVLAALAARLPDGQRQPVWTQALTASHMSHDYLPWGERWPLLTSLPDGLSADQLTEALTAARQAPDQERQARLLAGLAPQLPSSQPRVMAEALAAAARIGFGSTRREVLTDLAGLVADLPPLETARMLLDLLPILASRSRAELLEDVELLVTRLPDTANRPRTARAVAEAVLAVGQWWP